MFKNIRFKIATLLAAVSMLAVPLAIPAFASAQSTSTTDIQGCLAQGSNLDATGVGSTCTNKNTQQGTTNINNIIHTVINIFSLIVGVVSVIMIIIGGLRYITSGGDSNNVSGAKNTIIYAIIGLVVVALAQFIVQFVLNKVTG